MQARVIEILVSTIIGFFWPPMTIGIVAVASGLFSVQRLARSHNVYTISLKNFYCCLLRCRLLDRCDSARLSVVGFDRYKSVNEYKAALIGYWYGMCGSWKLVYSRAQFQCPDRVLGQSRVLRWPHRSLRQKAMSLVFIEAYIITNEEKRWIFVEHITKNSSECMYQNLWTFWNINGLYETFVRFVMLMICWYHWS